MITLIYPINRYTVRYYRYYLYYGAALRRRCGDAMRCAAAAVRCGGGVLEEVLIGLLTIFTLMLMMMGAVPITPLQPLHHYSITGV